MSYANIALKGTGLNQIEEFGILVTIRQERTPKNRGNLCQPVRAFKRNGYADQDERPWTY